MADHPTKVCSKCGEEKPLAAFSASRTGKLGRHNYCRGCKAKHEVSREKTRDYKAERERRAQPSGAQKRRAQAAAKEAALDARLRAIFAPRASPIMGQ